MKKLQRHILYSALLIFVGVQPVLSKSKILTHKGLPYGGEIGAKGFLAEPEGDGPYPALILIHEWWGLNDNIRGLAEKFAKEGYVALAVDMYDGKLATVPEEARKFAGEVRGDMESAFQNLKAAVDFLNSRRKVDEDRLGAVGWCFGGGWSYQMAKNNLGVRTSVIYYGRFNPKDDLQKMRAKIIGHFGEEDRAIRVDSVKEFQATLKTLSGDHEIYIYPNAGHAFANDDSPKYNKKAAKKAWKRTLKFLNKFL